MGRPRIFNHSVARAMLVAGIKPASIAAEFGTSPKTIYKLPGSFELRRLAGARADSDRHHRRKIDLSGGGLIAVGRASALSGHVRALRSRVRACGPSFADNVTLAEAHAIGMTLDEIAEIFAVSPAKAARAIALHAGR